MFTNREAEKAVIKNILDYQEHRGTPDVRLFSAINMTRPTWKTRLRGETSFTLRELEAICNVLGIKMSDLTKDPQLVSQEVAA